MFLAFKCSSTHHPFNVSVSKPRIQDVASARLTEVTSRHLSQSFPRLTSAQAALRHRGRTLPEPAPEPGKLSEEQSRERLGGWSFFVAAMRFCDFLGIENGEWEIFQGSWMKNDDLMGFRVGYSENTMAYASYWGCS